MRLAYPQDRQFLFSNLYVLLEFGYMGFCFLGASEIVINKLLERLGAVLLLGQKVAQFFIVVLEKMHVEAHSTQVFVFGYDVD